MKGPTISILICIRGHTPNSYEDHGQEDEHETSLDWEVALSSGLNHPLSLSFLMT